MHRSPSTANFIFITVRHANTRLVALLCAANPIIKRISTREEIGTRLGARQYDDLGNYFPIDARNCSLDRDAIVISRENELARSRFSGCVETKFLYSLERVLTGIKGQSVSNLSSDRCV